MLGSMGWFSRWQANEQSLMDAAAGRYDRGNRTGIELAARPWGGAPKNVPDPQLVLDAGEPLRARWGTTFHEATPGRHSALVFHRFLRWRRGSVASADVIVPEDGVVRIEYAARYPAWRTGTIRVDPK
jgi:hypothetical protein